MRRFRGVLFISMLVAAFACVESVENGFSELEEVDYLIPELTVNSRDTQLRKTVDLMLYQDVPFSGTILEYDDLHSMHWSTQYLNGLKHGIYAGYYSEGKFAFRRPYLKGEKHGKHQGWYSNAQPKFEYYFVNGFSEGNHKDWYKDGSLYKDQNYEKGHERGTQKVYRPDGKLRANYVVRENGRKYGLVGVKRCKNIDIESEQIDELKPE